MKKKKKNWEGEKNAAKKKESMKIRKTQYCMCIDGVTFS